VPLTFDFFSLIFYIIRKTLIVSKCFVLLNVINMQISCVNKKMGVDEL